MYKETKTRSIIKTIIWRVIATLNSFFALIMFHESKDLHKAVIMNISGFFIFYAFERVCNRIKWGKILEG
jgi:tryptophan-rich sensory protein